MYRKTLIIIFLLLTPLLSSAESHSEPPLVFSDDISFEYNNVLGSDGEDFLQVSDRDSEGNIYLASNVFYQQSFLHDQRSLYTGPFYDLDPDYLTFNITKGAYDTSYNGLTDIVLTKFTPGGEIIWSTYFGGREKDKVLTIDINSDDEIILSGRTNSPDFPLLNSINSNLSEITTSFISIFNTEGDLIRSTFFGGSYLDNIKKVILDSQDNIIISGNTKSDDFPLKNPAIDRLEVSPFRSVAFLSKLSPELELVYSTQIGGSETDDDYTIALANNDEVVMIGVTRSKDFPTTEDALDTEHNGQLDAFYTRFTTNGQIEVSTFIGGRWIDWVNSITIDSDDNAIMTGYTGSPDFPVNGEDSELNDGETLASDAIVVKISPAGQIIWSTFFGGENTDMGIRINQDSSGYLVVTGITKSKDFPIFGVASEEMAPNQGKSYENGDPPNDVFISKFAPDGRLAWSVVFGSTGMEYLFSSYLYSDDSLVVTGATYNLEDFPLTNNFQGGYLFDGFIAKIDIPETVLPASDEFVGYRDTINTTPSPFQETVEDFDFVSISILVLVVLGVLISLVSKSGILDKLRSKEQDKGKEDMENYLKRLRDL